jgi:hypothetical protein
MVGGIAMAADNGGLTVPDGFAVTVVQDGLGAGRHLAIAANGDIYLAGRNGLVAMRDSNGDGKVDETAPFGNVQGTSASIYKQWLYVSDDVGVYRYPLKKGELAPSGARQTVVSGFPKERQHADKTFTLDPKGTLYVNVGAPSNSCQEKDRQEGSQGRNPCPILDHFGGVCGCSTATSSTRTGQRKALCHRHAQRGGDPVEWIAERAVRSDSWPRLDRYAVPGALQRRGQRHAPG